MLAPSRVHRRQAPFLRPQKRADRLHYLLQPFGFACEPDHAFGARASKLDLNLNRHGLASSFT